MPRTVWLALVSVTLGLLAGCATKGPTPAASGATAIYFAEHEPDEEPTRTRMIVTPQYVRIDGDDAGANFLLYDRAARTIYNVSADDRLILILPPQAVAPDTGGLQHRIEREATEVPAVGGKKVRRYRLLTNDQLCYDLYAADGLLPEVVTALREYRQSLAGEHARALAFTPKEMQTPCDVANNVYLPARHLAHGFPVRTEERTGRLSGQVRTTELVDYQVGFAAAPALFQLPADYRRMTLQEFRER